MTRVGQDGFAIISGVVFNTIFRIPYYTYQFTIERFAFSLL